MAAEKLITDICEYYESLGTGNINIVLVKDQNTYILSTTPGNHVFHYQCKFADEALQLLRIRLKKFESDANEYSVDTRYSGDMLDIVQIIVTAIRECESRAYQLVVDFIKTKI